MELAHRSGSLKARGRGLSEEGRLHYAEVFSPSSLI